MALAWEAQVFSSVVQSVGYDADSGELVVTWKNGRRSAYAGVPEDVALDLSKAGSVGQMLNSDIKLNYQHRYA
jgi:hypothetical protein